MLSTDPHPSPATQVEETPTLPKWFTPAAFILAPVGASIGAWMVLGGLYLLGYAGGSWEKLAGFSEPAPLTPRSTGAWPLTRPGEHR